MTRPVSGSYLVGQLLFAMAAVSMPALAQVHRCVAADGKVSFSDTVCNGERAQKTFGVHSSARGWTVDPYRPPPASTAVKQALSTPPR